MEEEKKKVGGAAHGASQPRVFFTLLCLLGGDTWGPMAFNLEPSAKRWASHVLVSTKSALFCLFVCLSIYLLVCLVCSNVPTEQQTGHSGIARLRPSLQRGFDQSSALLSCRGAFLQ